MADNQNDLTFDNALKIRIFLGISMTKKIKTDKNHKDTKDKILDASEDVFCRKGYYGATIREIFELAGANRGLLSYYFESKEKLFEETIDRRFDAFRERFIAQFDSARGDREGPLPVLDFCRAYIRFLFEMAHDPDPGWRNYIRFLAAANSVYDTSDVHENLTKFRFIIDFSVSELSRIFPAASTAKIEQALLFLEASTSTLVVTDRLWEERMHATDSENYQELAEEMASFFASAIAIHCL